MTLTKKILITLVLIGVSLPVGNDSPLKNYGVKNRPVGQKVLSETVSFTPVLRERTYSQVQKYVPFVKEAARTHKIPANVLLAILFEEELHRKPVDLRTFGPAQIGLGELVIQGLPPRRDLLEDPEVSIYLLASKLKRVQQQTGSLQTAITLHNGYSDYLYMIQKSARDPRLLEMLESVQLKETVLA